MADTRTKKTPQWVGKAMLAIGIAVVVLSGCEIGLGEKVDVAAPTISLTSHQPGDFLKATAKLSGVAADDREIMTVQVALDRSGSFSDENVTVTKDGDSYTWTYTIDTTRRNDGPLYLTFQAVDTAGRAKKTDELRFDVDNSAPLVYLATPRNIAAAEGFNISEELEIQINDAYTPAFIAIQVYDGDGNNLVSKDRHSSIGGTEYAVESIGGNPSIVNYSAGTNWIFNFASADFYPADYDPEDYPNGFTFSIFVLSGDPAGNTSSYFYHIDDITKVGIEPGNLSSLRSRIADASTTPAKRENSSAKRLNLVFNEYLDIPWVRIGTLGHSAEDGRANINAVRNEEDLPYRIPAGGSLSIEARDDDLLAPGFPLLRIVDPETAVYDPSDDPEADKTRDQLVAEGWISLTPNSLNASPYSLDYSIPGDIGGTKWLYVLSRDNGGVQRLQRYDILLWRGDPELIIQTPEGGSGKGDIVFSGQATHPDADPVVELYRGGLGSGNLVLIDSATTQPLTGEDDPNWSFTVDSTEYTDGEYKFSIFAKIGGGDGAEEGVEGTKSREISLLIDNDAPQAPVYTGLTDGGVITSEEHTLTLVASDGAGSRVKAYEYRLSESDSWTTAERFGEIGEITLTGLQDSLNNTLYIRISDNVGNEAFDELDFSVSLSAPVFSVAGTWGVTSYRNTAEVVVSGSVTDSNGIAGVTASGAGAGTVVLDGSSGDTSRNWQVTLNPSAQGLNTLTLQTVDGAGITKTQEVSFTYDTLEPEMNVVNLEDGASISSPQYTITGTASDPSGLDTIEYSLNDGPAWDTWSPVDTLGQSWNHEVSGLSEGSAQQIRFRSRDKAGNTRLLDPITFGLDLNPPTLAVDTIAGVAFGDWNAGSALLEDFTITGSSTDANGIKSLEISMDGGVSFITLGDSPAEGASTNDTPVEFEQTVLISGDGSNDGLKAIIIRATDTYNKTSSRSFSVRFDASAPVVALSNLVDDQLITTSPFTLNGTWTDNGGSGTTGGQAKVEYSLDDATYAELTSGSSTFSGSIPFDEGLDQILYIRATDNVGNTNVTTVTGIDVDTALPNLAETSVNTTDIVLRNDGVTLGGTASDTLGLASVTISAEKDGTDQGVLPTDTDSPENWEYTLPAAGNDGLWVFTITAEDSAGRTRSLTRTVRLDSTPAVPSITAPGASEIVNGPTYTVAGTASDGGGSGVDEVRISFNADGSDSILVGGTSSWSANVTLSNYLSDEGPKTLYVQVLDNAGNLSPWNAVTQEFIYDTAKPSLTVDGSADRQEGGAFSLTGSTQDNYGVAAVDQWHITQEKDGGGVVTIDTGLPSTTGTDTNLTWELSNLPRDPADIGSQLVQDGEYVYTIRTEDLAGRGSDTRTITVVIDRTAPETLEITAPSSGQTGANALAGSAYTFRGSASDSGVGLEKIYYLISGASSAPTGTAGYTEIATSGTWSFTEDLDTDGLGADGGRAEGTWYLHVKAEDKAGNITADEDVVSVEFDIDQAAPSLTETGSGITGSAIAYRNADLTLSGTANDTNSLESVVVTYSKDGGASVELLNDTTDDGTWSTTLPVSAGDGAYEVTILATDEVGKTSSITRNIVIDTESPDLTLTAPVDGEFIDSGSYTIRGQVTDNGGKGVTSLEYSTDNATWTTIPLSGFNWSVTGVDFSTGGEGNRTLYVRATDGLNPESSQQVDFYYDTADPSLSEDNYSAAQEITNGDFTFTGDVSDTNALKDTGALVITASKDGGASSQVYSRSAAQIAADGGSYSYTVVLPDDGSDDGTWVYTITATDVAGRTTSHTRTFLIDETDPDTPVIDAFAGAYQVNELVSSGTAADGGSGLQTVEYSFDQSNWSPASGTSSWFRTVDISMSAANVNHRLGQGNRTLYVRAIDRAGNVSPVGSRSFTVDRADPVVTVDAEYDGTVYKNAGFTVNGTVTDSLQLAGSPIAITVDGPNTDDIALGAFNYTSGDGSWSQAVPIDDGDGSYSIAITGSDNVGRTHTVTRTVVVDTADPVVAVNNLNGDGSTQVNGATYTVSGTVTESGSGIASVEYSLDTTDGLDGTWQAATGTTSWAVALSGLTDTLTQTFAIRSTDNAGNTSTAVQREFIVDLAPPTLTESESGIANASIVYRNSAISLGGSASDANGVTSVVVTYSKDGGASVELLNDTTDDGTWSTTLPVSAGDGAYEVTILATDEVGKTSSITRNIVIDTESPDLTLTAPVDGEFIDSGSYTIRGQVTDNGGKGVTSLEYSTDNATWTTIPLSGFNWSVTGVDFSTGGEGNRTLYVRATDGLNPESSQQVDFYYDTADPSLSEDNYSAAQEITNGDFTFTGDVSDSNALKDTGALVITASKDGGASSQVYSRSAAQIAADGGSYSYTVVLPDDGSDDGTWVYTITATDVAGRTKSETRTFLIDETDPDTPVIDAFAGAYQVNELVSSGTAADGGSGLQTVEYSFDQSNWSPASGTSSWFRTVDISMSAANVNHRLGQGNRTLYVRAIDRAGNVSPVGSRSFTVDRADPVVTVDAEYDGTVYKNAGFTVNGTVTDSLQLAGSPIAITVDGPNTDDIALGAFNYTSGDGSWSQAVPIDDGDGSYSIAITGSDNVGRTHTVTRTVVVDTADPVVAVNNLNGDGSTQVNGATYTVSGTVTESGSGIAGVEYSLDTTDGLDGTWQAATGTTSWSVALSGLTDTLTQTFAIRSTDNAGNTSAAVQREFIVDLADPVLAVTGGNTAASLVYRNSDIVLSGTATDGNGAPGVTVRYSKDGGAAVTILDGTAAQWNSGVTLQLNAGPDNVLGNGDDAFLGDGEYIFTITATDAVGKTDVETRSVRIDTLDPTAEITSLTPVTGANTVNGIITIRAAVADAIALDTLEWALVPELGDPEPAYLTVSGSKTSPEFVIDTTQTTGNVTVNGSAPFDRTLTDEAISVLYLRARDRAGNEVVISQNLEVDQASDAPVITFTTIDSSADTPEESYLNLIESNGLVRITVSDDDLVNAGSAEISIGDNASWQEINYNGGTAPASSRTVTLNHDLYSPAMLAEGTTLFYLRVSDSDAGNAKSGLPTATTTVGPVYVMVDRNFPVITETALGGDVFRSAAFSISGTISDTNALTNLTVTQSKDGGGAVTVLDQDETGTNSSFSISNMPNGGASDGEYLYTLTLTDASDKQTVLERTVIIDTTDPEAPVVTSPTAASWISGATYEFQGTASDGTGSGIDTIYVTETARGAGAPAKGDPAWQEASLESGGTQWSRTLTVAAQGERDLHVYAVDEAGNDGAITTHAFGLDTGAPVVSFDGGSGILYGNGDFTVSGTFTDTSGLSHISVESSTDDANYVAASPSSASFDGGAGTWSWTRTIGAQAEGTYYYRFNMTDLAGNLRQVTKEVNLDKTAPVIAFTSAAPSISFNAGAGSASANGTMSLSGTVTEDQNVVNLASISYQLNEGASSALAVGSSFTISGIDTTSYTDGQPLYVDVTAVDRNGNEETQRFTFNVNQATDKPAVSITSPADSTTVTTPSVTIVGEATDDDGITADPDQVQYRFSEDGTVGGYGPWQHVALGGSATVRSFSFNITASTDGAKLVQIQAYDEHGTLSDPVTLNLTFDTNEPEFTGLSPAPDSYHSGDFTLSGTAVDDTGTVDTLRYKVDRNGSQVTGWTALPGTGVDSVPFSTTIDTSFGGGTYKITLEAVDDSSATRTTTVSVFVDTADPSAAFTAPGSGSTQNNIISVSGTSDDNYGVQSLDVVVVDVNDGNTEKALPTGTLSGTSTWTVSDLDTRNATLLSYAADEGGGVYTLTLRARATDLANRTATNDLSFTIDQSTDKPVITLDSIALDGSSTITTTTINGSVTDDDGIQSIVVDTWDVGNLTATPDRSETVTLTSGSYGGTSLGWRVILADNGNGLRALRVRAVDSDDNNGSDYSASDYSRTDSGKIEFQLDTQNPDVAFTAPSANITWSSNNTFTIQGTSGDETGVTGLLLKVNDNDFSGGTTVIPDSNADDWATWTYTFNQGDLNNGPHTIYVQATDSVGNTRIASRQISVDKTAPTISVTSPANGSAVFGPLTIGGTTADNAGGAGVDAVAVGLGNQIDPLDLENSTWTSVPGTTSWSFSFLNINDYANTTYAVNTGDTNEDGIEDVGETWTDLWDFTFYVRATDKAGDGQPGNTSYLTSYTLTIDPKRDRPEISILSPEDGSTVGGYVRVFGSAFDSQFVEKVQIAIDANNDGDYTNDTWSEGTLDETDGDGVAWYLANGTTSWNVRLNEAGEFDPTGGDTTRTITFKVRAKDYKENPGDGIYGAEVEYQVTFNKDFPKIEDVSIESGSTVGGIETLTAIIRDETDIDRIVFSNEGPLLGNTTIFQNPGGLLPPGAGTTTVASTANPYGGTDITVDLLGTGDPDYQAAYPGSYRVTIPINTQAAGLYNGGAGSMSVKLSAEDVTSPSPFTNQNLISFNVDNIAPSDLSYTGSTEIIGTQAEVQGTVRDTGTISGIDRIVVYMTNADGHLIQLKNGTGAVATFTPAEIYDEDDPTFENYRIIIDNRNELGNDGAVGVGDQDGFPEYLTISGGTYNWSASFNSEDVADGAVTLHYRAEDFSGNSAEDTTGAFIANNKPSITGVVLGTDLNGNGDADDAGEKTSVITAGYGSTNFTARNDLLFVQINVTGGNNRLYYVVRHPGAALDATATVNGEMYEIISQGTSDFTGIGAASNNPGTVFTATGAGTGTGTVYRVDYTDTAIGAGSASLEINTSAWAESEPLSNSTSVAIRVFDATSSQDLDSTDELSDTITVNLDVDNVDETPAEIEVAPVGRRWDNASEHDTKVQEDVDEWSENVVTTGSGVSLVEHGYVQYSAASADAEADVSGKVILLGRAYDNQRISRITAQIPDFNGGAEFNIAVWNGTGLESAGNSIEELGTDTDESIIWGFEVVPGSEFLTQADGHVLNWQFGWNTAAITTEADEDVRVTFRIYDTNTDNDGAVGTNSYLDVDAVPYITRIYNPSGQGGLSETVIRTARGAYSLENSAGDDFRIEGFNLSGASVYVSDTAIDTQPGAGALTTSAGSTSSIDVEKNLPGSGFLTVFVNGIPSLNNLNDLNAEYNSEAVATNPRSLQWTDDREIVVWDLTEVMSGTNDQTFYYPSMVMNGNQPIFSYANDNAGYTYRTTGDDTSAIRSGAWFERHTALARTPGGVYWIASVQDAFAGGGDIGYLYINRDRARNALLGGDGSTNTNHFEIQGLDYLSTQLNRIKYPKLIVDGPDDNTNVYLSYYDTHPSAKSLSFVSFRASSATNSNLAEPTSDAGRATQVQTIPGTANASSEHFDMVKIGASDMAVVYFDEGAGTLEMQYSSNAWDANNLSGGGTWTQQTIDASPLTGSHVSTSVGTVGGTTYLYIAYQDAANTSLKLATVNWTTKAVTTQVIDSHFSVGTRTNLHILDGLPHISYSSDSYVGTPNSMRLAYPVAANSRTAEQNIFQAGADEYDQFLGNWEVVSVPTIKTPRPGIEQFHRTMIDQYNDGTTNLPVVAWLADRIEYAKMLD